MPVSGTYVASGSLIAAGITISKLAEVTTTGSATSIAFTGLDISQEKGYYLDLYNVAGGGTIKLHFNADTTDGNYYSARFVATGAGSSNTPYTNRYFMFNNGTGVSATCTIIKLPSQKASWISHGCNVMGSNAVAYENVHGNWESTANITSITFTNEGGGAFPDGTRVRLYKL
jgi:hypothetical protein